MLDPKTLQRRPGKLGGFLVLLTVLLSGLHGWAIWLGIGGFAGLTSPWMIWRDDHPLYFHSALVTRHFLRQSWTTAGYDPAFMSGYAKSVVFPASSTLPELVIFFFGGSRPERAYKAYVFASAAILPWLIAVVAWLFRAGPGGTFVAVLAFLVYAWTDFPLNYAGYGMLPYLLAVPLGLLAVAVFLRFCEEGGWAWWLASMTLMAVVVLVHFTVALIVAPAAAIVYAHAWFETRDGRRVITKARHLGVWLIPAAVLAVNAFWWVPGIFLASTKGPSDFAFAHPEGVLVRLRQIVTTEAPIERIVWVAALVGFVFLYRTGRTAALGLLAFAASGFFWGYLAGGFRSLDFLQPGRHTYALYSSLALASGLGVARGLTWLRTVSRLRLDLLAAVGFVGLGAWFLGPDLGRAVTLRVLVPLPFLSSRPQPLLLWVYRQVKQHVRPGERLLYEEGGFSLKGVPCPFGLGRFSGLLPERLGIEVIGGPYLHASLTTNFTQFGEGKLFGRKDWDRNWFEKYARLYRPAAIVCWSPRARAFCLENPDLITVKDDNGIMLIGRVIGFEGATIVGKAEVKAEPGRLRVSRAEGGLDGSVVLRYHSVPCLRTDPVVALSEVHLEDDPVPFIRFRPPPGAFTIDLNCSPGRAP